MGTLHAKVSLCKQTTKDSLYAKVSLQAKVYLHAYASLDGKWTDRYRAGKSDLHHHTST